MFDVGFWEILLILVLALVIIGPERLPGAARKAGLFVGKARRYIEGVRSEVEDELDVTEFKRLLHNQEVQINELQQQIKTGVDGVKDDLPGVAELSDVMPQPYKDSSSRPLKNETSDADSKIEIETETETPAAETETVSSAKDKES